MEDSETSPILRLAMAKAQRLRLEDIPDMRAVNLEIAAKVKHKLNELVDEVTAKMPLYDLDVGDEHNNLFDFTDYFVCCLYHVWGDGTGDGALADTFEVRISLQNIEPFLPDRVFVHKHRAARTIQTWWRRTRAARTIQKAWQLAAYDPQHPMCISRLQKKIAETMQQPLA